MPQSSVKKKKNPRYIEISNRNRTSRIKLSGSCACGDVEICIRRAGYDKCCPADRCQPDNPCSCDCSKPKNSCGCDLDVATVEALEVDADGFTVFEWPDELLSLKEGWYEGHIQNGCNLCGVVPIRVGPRCNVIEVETVVSGPDVLCWVGCPNGCPNEDVCLCPSSKSKSSGVTVYVPDYIK